MQTVYSTLSALLDSIVGQLSWDIQEASIFNKQRSSPTKIPIELITHKQSINGTLSPQSYDNDCNLMQDNKHSSDSWWLTSLVDEAAHFLADSIRFIISTRELLWLPGKGGKNGALLIQAEAIRLIRLDVPSFVEAGQPVKLRCIYETKGDKLQSLSWYKNGHEFYRYQPFERRQPVLAFNYTGITVDLSKSKNSTVLLTNTTNETSGRYKCEATATTFQEVNMETYVTVVTPASDAASRGASTNHILGAILNSFTFMSLIIIII